MIWWNSLSDFLAMGGYGLYVWGSVLMTVVLLAGEVVTLRMRRNALMKLYGRWVRNTRRESNENKA
ncbi:MAG TPA: heme exporter protein CcmD [Noviherbaspirillum sp.]